MNLELSLLFVHIPLLIVNIYFEFQVYMFSNGRDMTKCHSFCMPTAITTNPKAIAISQVFSKKTVKLKNGGKFSKRVKNTVGKEKLLTTAEYHNKTFSSITKIQYAQF